MSILTLKDLSLENRKVLLRVDFNVPLGDDFQISDDSRIIAALPTIQYILDHGASVILLSHLGRPKGRAIPHFSLKVCAERLSEKLGKEVRMAPDCIGEKVDKMKRNLQKGQVLMLENVRFHPEETLEGRDLNFAKKLAKECDYFVNDAFGCCHRSQASIVDLPRLFNKKSAMGFLLEKETRYFKEHIFNPARPFMAIVGGAKISSKIGVLTSLIDKVDALLIGGAMAYTFLKALGKEVGNSLVEDNEMGTALGVIEKCEQKHVQLILPQDNVYAIEVKEGAKSMVISPGETIPQGWSGVDIGPKTIEEFQNLLKSAKTVLWNGPLGVFEVKAFANGTYKVAEVLSKIDAVTIIGGGDSAAAIKKMGLEEKFDHISTGGGASLEFIEKGHLLGTDALEG